MLKSPPPAPPPPNPPAPPPNPPISKFPDSECCRSVAGVTLHVCLGRRSCEIHTLLSLVQTTAT